MNDLDAYLKHHYITAEQLAAACSISPDELANLVTDGLVPEPSYTVTAEGKLISQAFGEFQAQGSVPGQYFHPGNAAWIALAAEVKSKVGAQHAHGELRQRFKDNFAAALSEFDRTIFRLSDSFTDAGQAIPDRLNARTEGAWDSFLKGIFSLCVADPSSERSIARKEILQEALTKLSDNGSKDDFLPEDKQQIQGLIAQYAKAAMPFSPLEYPRSSRKRLVEDLGAKLGAL
jgi:hypothetical protein